MVVYKGMEGCATVDMTSILKPLENFGGIIYMVSGLILTFAGGYSIQATLGLVLFLFVTGALLIIMSLF